MPNTTDDPLGLESRNDPLGIEAAKDDPLALESPKNYFTEETAAQLKRAGDLESQGRQMNAGNDQLLSAIAESLRPDPPTPQQLREKELATKAGVEPIPVGTRILSGLDSGVKKAAMWPRIINALTAAGLDLVGLGETELAKQNKATLASYAAQEADISARDRATFGDDDVLHQLAEGTGRAVSELPLYLAPGAAAKTPEAALKIAAAAGGTVGGGTQLATDLGEGRSTKEALPYAIASGLATALTTRAFGATGAEAVFRKEGIAGVRNRILSVLKDTGMEGAEEAVDQIQQDFIERYSRNPDKPFDATLKDVLMAGAIGGIVGGGVSGVREGASAASDAVEKLGQFPGFERDMVGTALPDTQTKQQVDEATINAALERLNQDNATVSSPAPSTEAAKSDTAENPLKPIEDLPAAVKDLQATMTGNQVKPVETVTTGNDPKPDTAQKGSIPPAVDDLLARAMADLPDDARAEIEQRLQNERVESEVARLTAEPARETKALAAPEGVAGDKIEGWLTRAIESTDIKPGDVMEGVTGAPVWLTKSAANGVLRVVRAAYRATKNVAQSIQAGLEWLREQKLAGFDEQEARVWLDQVANDERQQDLRGTPSSENAADDLKQAEADLMTAIRQHMTPPEGMTKAEALAAKNAATSKLRKLQFERLQQMTSTNVDTERSPEQTAEMISEAVDLFNTVQDEISGLKARSQAIPADLTKLLNDLQTRINLLKGWSNDQTEAEARGQRSENRPAPTDPEARGQQMRVEAATNPERKSFGDWWRDFQGWLRKFASPIPELPLTGDRARKASLFRRGFRLFTAETNRVRADAAAKLKQVLEPLEKLRVRANNDVLKEYFRAGVKHESAYQSGDQRQLEFWRKRLAELEAQVNTDPFNIFRKIVIYRDLWWRATYLKTESGQPITLPTGLTLDQVAAELRSLYQQLDGHADKAAITETLRRHYALTDELQKSIIAHGEIIPEAMRNPLYYPHHLLKYWTDRIDRVRPTTEEDFRKYLIDPKGSGDPIQADYLKAMYQHTADVLAHNARVDLVQKYWQPYDISKRLKEQHGEAWDKPWNIPPGYKLFAPFKKLPLRMDYILTREVLADKLGVLFNDGDLRARAGEAGGVLKIKPEDLQAAMVAGEKIKWALPVEIADALDGISQREAARSNPGEGHALGMPVRWAQTKWKQVKLFAPWSWLRYEYGNLTTDLVDKVMVADPKVATYLKQAAGEILRASHYDWDKSEAFKAASREGVFDTITASEAGELQRLREFSEFASSGENARNVIRIFTAATTKASHFRESTFRYAKFLADVERMKAGQLPVYAGAYHKDIEALGEDVDGQQQMLEGDELIYAKAAEISLKTFGDYNSLGVYSQWLRTYLIPFHSWTDVNFRYHANQLRNIADGIRGIKGGTPREVALKYAAVRVVTTLAGVAIAQQLWNTVGGVMAGLWDEDDDLESQLSAADRRRSHIILGKDKNGQVLVAYTPSAFADVAEWVGGLNAKRLFLEYAKGDITLDQFIKDYAKQLPEDFGNKVAQSLGPWAKGPTEFVFGKSIFPDVFDQRNVPSRDRWWRLAGTMTDDRAVNWLRQAFDKDFYSQPMAEQLQQIILQVRRRDPEQWAYYEAREAAADWKWKTHGKKSNIGDNEDADAQVLRNFRRAIYRADVAAAEQFYKRLLEYGYTAERLDASIKAQAPLSHLSKEQRKEYLATLDVRGKREMELAERYYSRIGALDKKERRLFPTDYRKKHGSPFEPNEKLLREVMERQPAGVP